MLFSIPSPSRGEIDLCLSLGVPAAHPSVNQWVGYIFYIPAVAGGIFGLLGGYLTDLFGRRRVLVWSILLYAFSAFAAGYATSVWWLLFWRVVVSVPVWRTTCRLSRNSTMLWSASI